MFANDEMLFTALILAAPVTAANQVISRGMSQIGFFDLSQSVDDPQTLVLISGTQEAMNKWASEVNPSLIWFIAGDALSAQEGSA